MENIIYGKKIDAHLICPICKKPFIDPVSLPSTCEQTFCRTCIEPQLENHVNNCQDCQNKTLTNQDLKPEGRVLNKMLDELIVNCHQCKQGNIQRRDFLRHLKEFCPKRLVSCPANNVRCSWKGFFDELGRHSNSCPHHQIRDELTELINNQNSFQQLQNQYQNLMNEKQKIQSDYERLTQFTNQLGIQLKRLEDENKILKEGTNEIDQLKQDNQLLNQIQTENENLREQIKNLETKNQTIKDQYETNQNKMDQMESFLQTTYQNLQEHQILVQNLKTENQIIEEQKDQLDSLIEENYQLRDQLEEFYKGEKEISSLTQQIDQLNRQLNQNQLVFEQLNQQITQDQLRIEKQEIIIQRLNRTPIQTKELSFNCEYKNQQLKQLIDQCQSKSLINLTNEKLNENDIDIVINYGLIIKQSHSILLCNNFLNDRSLIKLFSSLNFNQTLVKLSIKNNCLSELTCKSLYQSLSFDNQTLEELNLSSNQINDQAFFYLSDIFKSNQTIVTFGIHENVITDKSMEYFEKIILNYENSLENVSFYSNRLITDSSIQSVINMIENKTSLKSFWIWDCGLSEQGKEQIRNSIQSNNGFELRL